MRLLTICFLAVEESQNKLESLEAVTAEYQRAQEEAAEQARKAALLAEQLQETEHMHEEEKRRLVGGIKLIFKLNSKADKSFYWLSRNHSVKVSFNPLLSVF